MLNGEHFILIGIVHFVSSFGNGILIAFDCQ
jgi:hypothetical protein